MPCQLAIIIICLYFNHEKVEFTDTTNYKNFRLANLYNFTMAAMGPPGALFAAKSSDG